MKAWKWTRRFGLDVDVVEGEVHQHRLAAPDPAPQIDAAQARLPLAEQPAEQARRCSDFELAASRSSAATARCLRRIGLQLAGRDERGIGPPDGPAHAGALRSRDALQRAGEAVAGLAVLLHHALQEDQAARLLDQLDMRVERDADLAAREEMGGQVERHIMPLVHARAAPAGEHRHVDEAHHRAAVDRAAHVHVRLGREHARNRRDPRRRA